MYRLLRPDRLDPNGLALEETHNAFVFPSPEGGARTVTADALHQVDGDASGWGTVACVSVSWTAVADAYISGRSVPALRRRVLDEIRALARSELPPGIVDARVASANN